jgi:hypothetical protein
MPMKYDELYDRLESHQNTTANLVFRKVESKLAEFQAAARALTEEIGKHTEDWP